MPSCPPANTAPLSRLLAAGALWALSGLAAAGPYEDGVAAFERGDFAAAVKLWHPGARQGHAAAQSALGMVYLTGQGTRANPREAAKWLGKAGAQGEPHAQYLLGALHEKGEGVAKNLKQALAWYRKAADQGHADAQVRLGVAYAQGAGVPADLKIAADWYRRAAEQNHAEGQNALGALYHGGRGVPQSDLLACMLFILAAEQGNQVAGDNADYVARGMTARDTARAEKLASAWRSGQPLPDPGQAAAVADALPDRAEPGPPGSPLPKLACDAGNALKNTYTPVELYLTVNDCLAEKRHPEAARLFVLAGLYGYYDQLRVRDRSAHQAITVLKMAVTPNFSDAFRDYLSSRVTGPGLAELCATVRAVGRPEYDPGYMINHGLGALRATLSGTPSSEPALDGSLSPEALWEQALDGYLHCPK